MKFTVPKGIAALGGTDYARLLERSNFDVGIYMPQGSDLQKPHHRDEIYVIAQGKGQLVLGDQTYSCSLGEAFFVPAGMEHRFINFSAGFCTWVIFLGPRRAG